MSTKMTKTNLDNNAENQRGMNPKMLLIISHKDKIFKEMIVQRHLGKGVVFKK